VGRLILANDPVNHPAHYTSGNVECIDAIAAALGHDGFVAFLRGQIIKYTWRLGLKDAAIQDAAKAVWYANKLTEALSNDQARMPRNMRGARLRL